MEFVAGMRLSLMGFEDGGGQGDGEEEDGVGVGKGNARVEEVGRDEVECLIANMIYKVSFELLVFFSLSAFFLPPLLFALYFFFFPYHSFPSHHKHSHRASFQRWKKEANAHTQPQNLMKGYISREHAKVVLSKAGAFPGTGV